MSAGYNSGLSEYPNKGKLNLKEVEDGLDEIKTKIDQLAQLILESNRTVVHTGAGISTSCGIPDFRGPKVVIKCPVKVLKLKNATLITIFGSVDKGGKRRKSRRGDRMVKCKTIENAHGSCRIRKERSSSVARVTECRWTSRSIGLPSQQIRRTPW